MYSLTLYHHPLSVCSMKVRLALEEKGLAWSGRLMDIIQKQEQLEPWYLALNPKGVIPTLEYHNGSTQVVTDSAEIIRFIAQLPERNTLLPQQEVDLKLMHTLIDLANAIDLQILSYARHPSQEKSGKILDARIEKSNRLAEKHPELTEQYQTCAARSEKSKTFRVSAKHIEEIEQQALEALAFVENELGGKPFLLGDAYTLADVIWTVVLSRFELLDYKEWLDGKQFPLVFDYYQRVKRRKSFSRAQIQNHWWEH